MKSGFSVLGFPSIPSESDSNDKGASVLRGIAASMYNLKKLSIEEFYELK
ncbi:hypothetical protein A2U01_0073219, partial [Trifolium medium]|nr:hypothetical protein [Trifolium medium]